MNPYYLMSLVAVLCAVALVWWLARRQGPVERPEQPAERLDTLAGWPPEPTRVLRSTERLAFSTLKLALPGYMILAQVPIARFLTVPKRNSYAEWMRRIGSQCVDFVICDVTSQVVGVVEIRAPGDALNDRVRVRQERVARSLKAAHIPLHVWNEEKLPTIEAAREKILPNAPAVPAHLAKKPTLAAAGVTAAAMATVAEGGAVVVPGPGADPFADTDRDWTQDEVIEVLEPSNNTWFDDMDSVTAELPPAQPR
ncbi:MAG TPA: DUF2726 domain-containing protein [Caldimonas sp.]|jgi:hypothetical protein|nr:DUF2726 domain-containing protein [Caldimonas sp.]HEX2540890.1 DUF2726 domain-containing protein [Caldimonas sp.]